MLQSYQYQQLAQGEGSTAPGTFTHRYAYSYASRDTYLETQVTGSSDNSNYQAASTISSYDAYGRRRQVREVNTVAGVPSASGS